MESVSSIANQNKFTRVQPTWQIKDYLRYLVWLGVAGTANANRRRFGLPTTWVYHLVGNTAALLFPEIYRAADNLLDLKERLPAGCYPTGAALRAACEQLVCNNPDYFYYVAPAALGYIASHPRFNIYKGTWGEWNIMGFGLDTLPHSATAYALSNLAYDTIAALDRNLPDEHPLRAYLDWLVAHKPLATAGLIILLTVFYEVAEYRIHQYELEARDHNPDEINMMWDPQDTVFDVLSNGLGWALATWRQGRVAGPAGAG